MESSVLCPGWNVCGYVLLVYVGNMCSYLISAMAHKCSALKLTRALALRCFQSEGIAVLALLSFRSAITLINLINQAVVLCGIHVARRDMGDDSLVV